MKATLKFYMAIFLMIVGLLCGAVLLTKNLPPEYVGIGGSFVMLFGGGGCLYAIFKLAFDGYCEKWTDKEDKIFPLMSAISSGVAVLLQVIILLCYKDTSLFGVYNFLIDFNGNIGEFFLRILSIIASGFALFPLYLMSTEDVDTNIYVWKETTYFNGVEIDSSFTKHRRGDSKIELFFITLIVSMVGLMASALPTMLILAGLNVAMLFEEKIKIKKLCRNLGIISALVTTIIMIIRLYLNNTLGDADFVTRISAEIFPLVFAGCTALFFYGYFKWEFMSGVFATIIAAFMMIFIAWIVSFGLAYGLTAVVGFIGNLVHNIF